MGIREEYLASSTDLPSCPKCGKELEVGFPCEACWSHEVWKSKSMKFVVNKPERPDDTPLPRIADYGWVCPRCGSVNSPNLMRCFCSHPYESSYKVTC
jgi:hypothetical protein